MGGWDGIGWFLWVGVDWVIWCWVVVGFWRSLKKGRGLLRDTRFKELHWIIERRGVKFVLSFAFV